MLEWVVVVGGNCPTGTTVTGARLGEGIYEGVCASDVSSGFWPDFVVAGPFGGVVLAVVGAALVPSLDLSVITTRHDNTVEHTCEWVWYLRKPWSHSRTCSWHGGAICFLLS